jgi:PadR family transcriptional regulator, regulatory protein PadR
MLGDLEQVVLLSALRLGETGYGVSIRDEIHKATQRDLTLGTIHKTLMRLEQKGFVESRLGEATPQRGGRAKRHYQVTPEGLKALRTSLRALRRMAEGLSVGLERS